MALISEISNQLDKYRKDPAIIQAVVLEMLENVSNGQAVVVDPNNPFALGIEMSVALATNNINEMSQLTRELYPSLAINFDEVSRHMSDYDYRDIFSVPGKAQFVFLFDKQEVLNKTVVDPDAPGIRKITIPRYTNVIVSNTTFTLLYPIDIQFVQNGAILVTYDNSSPTPLQPLSTNMLKWDLVVVEGREYLRISADLLQLKIERYTPQINHASGFSREYILEAGEYFHYLRAFVKSGKDSWGEIFTTHSNKVYDPKKPTVLVKAYGNILSITIPQIYANNGLITDMVRLDIYTTKGPINLTLNHLPVSEFQTYWDRVPNETLSMFSAPLLTLTKFSVYSTDVVTGGRGGISFGELRTRVIERSLNTEGLPITKHQLNNYLTDIGYKLVTNIDNITDRQFLATRRIPPPATLKTVTGISATVETLITTMVQLELNKNVIKNNLRDTIKPTTLYELVAGKLYIVDDVRQEQLAQLKIDSPDLFVSTMNTKKFLYSPYYYVIDTTSDDFGCRVYDLDKPSLIGRFFQDMNSGAGRNFSFKEYKIEVSPNKDGYYLYVHMDPGEVAKELGPKFLSVQLSYKGRHLNSPRYFINGKLVSNINPQTEKPFNDDYVYRFHIETRYDIDDNDGLILIPYKDPIPLTHEFDIISIMKDHVLPTNTESSIASFMNPTVLEGFEEDRLYTPLSHEKVKIKFGERLTHLWHRTRTISSYDDYERYESDIVDYFDKNVYELGPDGKPRMSITKEGKVNLALRFKKGDKKVDQDGNLVYKHRKGEVVMDASGQPIIKGGTRGVQRHIDLFLLDARYLYIDNAQDIAYRDAIHEIVSNWCTVDMKRVHTQLLERSEIFYYPVQTTGKVEVLADDAKQASINAEQKFEVTYWMTEANFKNTSIRDMVESQTVEILQASISDNTVSLDRILDDIRLNLASQIVSVRVDGFCDGQYNTITLKDNSIGLSIGKSLKVLTNNQLTITNDVKVNFLVHVPQ